MKFIQEKEHPSHYSRAAAHSGTIGGNSFFQPPRLRFSNHSIIQRQAPPTYTGKTFTINNNSAVVRDESDLGKALKYKEGDQIPEGKKAGDFITIPNGTQVSITDHKLENDKLKYVKADNYGWTSVDNIKGGLLNEALSVTKASGYISQAPEHKTVQDKTALVQTPGISYPEVIPRDRIEENSTVKIKSRSSDGKFAEVEDSQGQALGWTSLGNLSKEASPDGFYKVTNKDARKRQQKEGFTPTSQKISFKAFVIVKEEKQIDDKKFCKIAYTVEKDGNHIEDQSKPAVWTNAINLADGWTDITSDTAMWKEHKFLGHSDIYQVVGTGSEIKKVTVEGFSSFQKMTQAAAAEGVDIRLNSGFRTYAEQKYLYDNQNKPGFNPANAPGDSEHQNGKAYDLNNKQDPAVNTWLKKNAWKYGFSKTYSGYKEHHHWEYVPNSVKIPETITKNGKKYLRTYFAIYSHKEAEYSQAYEDQLIEEPKDGKDTTAK